MTQKDMPRIKMLFSEPVPQSPQVPAHHAYWRKIIERTARPGVTVDFTGLKQGYYGITGYEQLYDSVEMVKKACEAEQKGYDVFIIGCASDMALKECRSLVNIPVVAPTESTSLVAATLGERFSIIDLQSYTRPVIERAVRNAGLIDKLASIRSPEGLNAGVAGRMTREGKQDQLVEMLRSEMVKAVKEDGAEALFVSCIVTSALVYIKELHDVEGAPVLDIMSPTIKMAEVLFDMKKAHGIGVCRRSSHLPPSAGFDINKPIMNEMKS